jgi:hypothetical protein
VTDTEFFAHLIANCGPLVGDAARKAMERNGSGALDVQGVDRVYAHGMTEGRAGLPLRFVDMCEPREAE